MTITPKQNNDVTFLVPIVAEGVLVPYRQGWPAWVFLASCDLQQLTAAMPRDSQATHRRCLHAEAKVAL
eukprot:6475432-Amphidinium_carterae.1